jgi:transcriptional regulator with XRE-family HTH domain
LRLTFYRRSGEISTMRLSQYLEDHDLTYGAFAARIGVSQQAVARYATGERIPRREVMQRIACVTKGAVRPNDFFDAKAAA